MKKITEVNLISEGFQLREIIDGKYTHAGLAKRFGIQRNTMTRYLDSMKFIIPKFIKNVEDLFEKPLNEIIHPVEDQIKSYLLEVKDKIDHYNKTEDNKVIDDLYNYAKSYSPLYDQVMAKGNVALYQYNMGLHNSAELLLKEILKTSKENDFKEHIVYYTLQLAFIYLDQDIKKARKILNEAEIIINNQAYDGEIAKVTLFNYYHFFGVVLRRSNKHNYAREMFKKALECNVDDYRVARALSNIGLTYYGEEKYKAAIGWSKKALAKCEGNIEMTSGIQNNMANIYYAKGENPQAYKYLADAIDNFTEDFDTGCKLGIYDTYIDFYANEGAKLLDVILNVFNSCTVINQYQAHLATCVEKLIHQLQENGDYINMKKLFFSLSQYTKSEGEKRYVGELKALLVDIMHILEEKGALEFR